MFSQDSSRQARSFFVDDSPRVLLSYNLWYLLVLHKQSLPISAQTIIEWDPG